MRDDRPEYSSSTEATKRRRNPWLSLLSCGISAAIVIALIPHAIASIAKAAPTDRGLLLTAMLVWFAPAVASMVLAFTRRAWLCLVAALWYLMMGGVNWLQEAPLSPPWVVVICLSALLGLVSLAQVISLRRPRRPV